MPSTRRRPLLRQTIQFLAAHGLPRATRILAHRLRSHLTPSPRVKAANTGRPDPTALDPYPHHTPPATHPFDLTHHVSTSGFTRGEDLAGSPALGPALWATAYYGIAPSIFRTALHTLAVTAGPAFDPTRFTFVDLGCGKGRALLLASALPFLSILGVELDPTLASTARQNLTTFQAPWQQCRRLHVRTADATTLDYPRTPLVVYLYHPFLAPLLRRVLRQLERSLRQHPRELWLLYINPEAGRVLADFPFLRERHRAILTLAPEDQLADRFGSISEEIALFQASA